MIKDVATRTKRGIAERCLRLMNDRYESGERAWDVLPGVSPLSSVLTRIDTIDVALLQGAVEARVEGYVEEPVFNDAGDFLLGSTGLPVTKRIRTNTQVVVQKPLSAVQRLELREERSQLKGRAALLPKQSKDIVSFLTYGVEYLLERFSFDNLQAEFPCEEPLKLLFPRKFNFHSQDYEKVLQGRSVHVDQIDQILMKHYPEDFKEPGSA